MCENQLCFFQYIKTMAILYCYMSVEQHCVKKQLCFGFSATVMYKLISMKSFILN